MVPVGDLLSRKLSKEEVRKTTLLVFSTYQKRVFVCSREDLSIDSHAPNEQGHFYRQIRDQSSHYWSQT